MARRWWVRGIVWTGIGFATLIGVLLFVLVLVTQSAFGREQVRQIAVRVASGYLLGSLHLGSLRFGPGCALAIDSAALRDPDDSLLVSLGPTRATCDFGALVHRRLVVTSLEVARPNVVVRQLPSGIWNWSRAIKPDTSPPAPSTGGPSPVTVVGPIRLSGGAVVLEVPWAPPDSLRGAARDRAIDSALAKRVPIVRRSGNALLRRRELTGISIDAALVRTAIGDTTVVAQLNGLTIASVDPEVTVHRIAGRVTLIGSSVDLDLPTVAFNQSSASARGHVDWSAAGMPAIQATVVADTLAFADLASFVPNIPGSGGGRLRLTMKTDGGTSPTEYAVSEADLRTTRSVVRGGVTIELSGSNELTIRDAALDLAPLHTELLNALAPGALPPELRGGLTGRVVVHGGARGALRVDTLAARYTDEAVPGSVSRVTARGAVTLGSAAGISFSRLAVAADPVDARTVVGVVPSLAPLSGRLVGRVTLDSTLERLRFSDADLRYAEGTAAPLRVTGSGRIVLSDVPRFDLALNAQPFSPAALAQSYPALATLPTIEGRVEVKGSAQDLTFATTASSPAGSASLVGRYSNDASGVAIRATGKVHDVDPRSASSRTDVPTGKLAADVNVDLAGKDFQTLRGSAALTNLAGTVSGITIDSSLARVALTDTRVVAESVVVATSAGAVSARGALGLHADVRDTLMVTASASLANLAPLLRALGVVDSITPDSAGAPASVVDSLGGAMTARARLVGSLDSLDTDGEVVADTVTSPFANAKRAHATWSVVGLRSTPRGQASLRADSLATSGVHLASASVGARSDDGATWRVTLGTAGADRPGGAANASVVKRGDTLAVAIDSLLVRIPGTDLQLIRPARFRRAGGTIVLDTLQLRGTRGAVITASGVYHDTGSVAASLDLANAPAFLPGPGGAGDSVRVLLDATVRLDGTAQAPRATADLRAHVADDDSLPIDSVVAHLAYADSRAQATINAHASTRRVLSGRVDGPVQLSLSPFEAALLDEPVTGQLSIDSLYLPDISRLVPGARFTAGVLRTNLTLSGTAKHPRAVGSTSLAGGAALIEGLGVRVHDANASVQLATDRVTIEKVSLRAGDDPGGSAELTGTLGLADSGHVELHFRTASMPVMRLPTTADLDVTSDLQLVGPYARPTLSGRITVDRGVLRLPDMGRAGVVGVDDTAFVRLVDSLAPARIERASTPLERFAIGDVQVAMGPNVWIRSAEASVQLGGSINLEPAAPGPGVEEGQVALRGRLVTQRGNYRLNIGAFTRSFELEQGSVQFTGEPELNPRLDINAVYSREGSDDLSATSSGRMPKVRAHLGGTLERPVLTLSSADAKLTQAELMSYLVTGQANSALGNAVDESVITSELVASATGALAQRLAGGMFDVVNVTPGSTTDQNDNKSTAADAFSSSRLGVGKQLSNRLFLTVDAGLCALTGGTTSADLGQTLGVSLDYRFRRGVHGSVSSAPSTNGATCANQASGRGTAITPRQWGVDLSRVWRF
ncbi:MAG TPA: translocation/assembly module TamB domain-containing protein [Gemmatimonadaceae bacterium]|nr:translocation/assembly module TamB domain-containing protein [Gemmatimonadaceae bacterium]